MQKLNYAIPVQVVQQSLVNPTITSFLDHKPLWEKKTKLGRKKWETETETANLQNNKRELSFDLSMSNNS